MFNQAYLYAEASASC